MFKDARIPPTGYELKLSTLPGTSHLVEYINSPRYDEDRKAGIGFVLQGPATSRIKAFTAMARAFVLKQDSVLYVHLATLEAAVTVDNHPVYDDAVNCGALFIQSAYDDSVDMPITGYARLQVETFLRERIERGQRNCFSMSKPMLGAGWWSADFRAAQNEASRPLTV
ncbi:MULTISPECIES: hypothetical protein [unclassified Bradyrhizobium]|uniref:hypothetical protein n=1 Tax=unclassified Bradyrhizobium TaxID=2631580 RepID=UPI0033929F03